MESDPSLVGTTVKLEAALVDDDVMMKPAERNEIVRVGSSAVRRRDDVVGLDPVAAVTTVGGTNPAH